MARETFIPFRRTDLVHMLRAANKLDEEGAVEFFRSVDVLIALFHFEYHQRLERIKDAYAPVNPDRDTLRIRNFSSDELSGKEGELVDDLRAIIKDANYAQITEEDLNRALNAESLFRIRLHVDFDDFEEVLFFRRGASRRTETLSRWFGLRKTLIEFTNYDRVVVYVRFKDAAYFEANSRGNILFEPGSVILKLFQNVPEADLEMLFPNTEVRMKTIDKLAIGVPAAVSGVLVLTSKLGATLVLVAGLAAFWLGVREKPVTIDQTALLALAGGFGALAAYVWKQFSSFKNRKIRFMKMLSDNLYFKNLDNNVGVFHHLCDAAEEEECKEAILALYFLWQKGSLGATELDSEIEAWFETHWSISPDFDVQDALHKLQRLGLASVADDRWQVLPMARTLSHLDELWDAVFEYRPAE